MAVTAIHPGEHLAEELEALEMSAAELARKISVPTNRVTQILSVYMAPLFFGGFPAGRAPPCLRVGCRHTASGIPVHVL